MARPSTACTACRCCGAQQPVISIVAGVLVSTLLDSAGMIRFVSSDLGATGSDLVLLRRAKDRIDREYARPLDVESIAHGVGMSGGHFSRRFRAEYGEAPYSYLMTRRVERAMALLRTSDRSVTEVCFVVGFTSLGTFSTRFSELVGMSPSAYRDRAPGWEHDVAPCVAMRVTKPVRNREARKT